MKLAGFTQPNFPTIFNCIKTDSFFTELVLSVLRIDSNVIR